MSVGLEEIADPANGLFQIVDSRQGHDTEMVRPRPVERRALDNQQFFRQQQVEYEFFIVVDRADLRVDPWECIQRAHRLDAADAGNVIEKLPGAIALFQQAAWWQDQIIDALVAAQRGLDRMLARYVGTQAHIG